MTVLMVFLGGGLGAVSRFFLASAIDRGMKDLPFPLGIFTCNLLGCFLIGCLFGYSASRVTAPWIFPFLATGFLGGFTTFSTYGKDSHQFLSNGLTGPALLNIFLSVALGLVRTIF